MQCQEWDRLDLCYLWKQIESSQAFHDVFYLPLPPSCPPHPFRPSATQSARHPSQACIRYSSHTRLSASSTCEAATRAPCRSPCEAGRRRAWCVQGGSRRQRRRSTQKEVKVLLEFCSSSTGLWLIVLWCATGIRVALLFTKLSSTTLSMASPRCV